MALKVEKEIVGLGAPFDLTNGGAAAIEMSIPYIVQFELTGVCDILLHRYNAEEVEAKGAAPKGSKAKKTDNLESYVYRDDEGFICLPGTYVQGCLVGAAKSKQDPRSPRKSAQDLYKAGVVPLTPLASFGVKTWAFEHKERAVLNRSAITRVRPALKAGWKVQMDFLINLPEYIPIADFHDTLVSAGKTVGVADHRPTYGRFQVTSFKVQD